MPETPEILAVPEREPVRYRTNFIKVAVCELRFPTVLEFEQRPPMELAKLLRKDYPHYAKEQTITVTEDGMSLGLNRYLLKSKRADWTVAVKSTSIALETSAYTVFEDFLERLQSLLKIAMPALDTDFFTRVGLRYINAVPIDDGPISEWINSCLVATIQEPVLGRLLQIHSEIRGNSHAGCYTFRHGTSQSDATGVEKRTEYMLDFDHYKDNVSFDETYSLLMDFRKINFSFFMWALGPRASLALGEERT